MACFVVQPKDDPFAPIEPEVFLTGLTMDASFIALTQACAPNARVETLAAIVQVESAGNPYAIRLNSIPRNAGAATSGQPVTRQEAVARARALILAGQDVDLGLTGLNADSLEASGLSLEQAFDPCASLRVAAKRLEVSTTAAKGKGQSQAEAEETAIAAYFGQGDPTLGRESGYLARVLRMKERLAGRLTSLRVTPSEAPLPPRGGLASSPSPHASADTGRSSKEPPEGKSIEPATAATWDVFRSVRGNSLLVYDKSIQRRRR